MANAERLPDTGEKRLPLEGIRVADFTWIGAGSYTTKILADMGAEVIKVETSTYLDSLRNAAPFKDKQRGVNRSGYFADRNTNKKSLTLNMKHPAARELALRLIAQSDIVANNFTPGTMEKFGLGYQEVREVRPDIIYLAMSMFGSDGPEHKLPGYGTTVSAISGLHGLCGAPDRDPVGTGTNFPDHIPCPSHAGFAILAALRHRRRTGQGQHIDLAENEAMVALLGPTILDYTVNGRNQVRARNRVPEAAPCGVYPCAGEDRWIAISIRNDAEWQALAEVLEDRSLAADDRFATVLARQRHHDELDRVISARTRNRSAYELMGTLQTRGVAAGVAQNSADLITADPQLRHRDHWVWLDHAEMGRTIYNNQPFRMGLRTDEVFRSPAPLLGQHTLDVCTSLLGMSEQEVGRLVEEGLLK